MNLKLKNIAELELRAPSKSSLGARSSSSANNERGIALIMTVFVVALLTIIVLDFAEETVAFQRRSRLFSERVQADAIIKSTVNLSRILLELPKLDGATEDWLGEPWALIAAAPQLPISGFVGEPRLMIVDETGKINVNAIIDPFQGGQAGGQSVGDGGELAGGTQNPQASEQSSYWKNTLSQLFSSVGIIREQFEASQKRTLGGQGFAPNEQVAVIHDWLDANKNSHIDAAFPGEGIESSANQSWFFNHPLTSVSEMLQIPGMTRERLQKIAPYIRVSPSSNVKVNINTAPLPVLVALGLSEGQAAEIIEERSSLPINNELLSKLTAGDQQITRALTTRSQEFSVYVRVKMPNITRYAKAQINIQPGSGQNGRRAIIKGYELL